VLNTAQISLQDVLNDRRKQVRLRIIASMVLCGSYALLFGWLWISTVTLCYIATQILEMRCFTGPHPWMPRNGRRERALALGMLAVGTALFGAQTVPLTRKLGSWGDVYGAYILCAALLITVLTTIGCRPAFRASATPLFFYVLIMPFNSIGTPGATSSILLAMLFGGALSLVIVTEQLWQRWSRGKATELRAVRRYVVTRDRNEQRLARLAQQDALTGLANRDVLQSRLAQNAANGGVGALLMIDLDGFKFVNDTLGHSAGDMVLREIARRIQGVARPQDITARLGGDEFALLMPGAPDAETAHAMAQTLITAVSHPVSLDGHQINIGASIGIVLHPLQGEDAGQLFANADLALYQAKAEGRHCARIYHPHLRAMAQGRVLRDSELALALERGEFEIHYQPQFRLSDGKLTGAEALLRWRHPQRGLMLPGEFLTALEGGLLSARVGAWAIATSCRQAAVWRAEGAPDFRIAVNLFGAQFRSGNLVAWVTQACAEAGLPPAALEIEITENVILRHEDNIIAPLQELRALGVGVAFDDYGTGYASLSMLTRFPVSRLKIDRSFIKSICTSQADAAIVHAIIGLARGLRLNVTAEGIETPGQLAALMREGCDEGQGYHLGKPMSAASFAWRFKFGSPLPNAYESSCTI
jgi:diguanylate cyclase (GGDEF)-like protein